MDILQHEQIVSDKLQGVIRNPFAFYFLIQWGFGGPIQTLHFDRPGKRTAPSELIVEDYFFSRINMAQPP